MPEQFTDGNIGAFGAPISPADREVTESSLNKIPDVGLQGYTDSGAYSSNYPSGMVGSTPQDEIRYRQEHEPYNYQPDDDQFVYITKAYLYEIHPLLNEEESKLIKKHELSPLKIKLDTKKGCVYTQFMVDQQGKVIGEYNLLKTEEDEPPDSTPFQLLNADGDDEPDKYGIYNVLIFKFADGVILRNNYDSDKDDPRSVRGHGGIEGHRGPLIWSRGYNTINNLGIGGGMIYEGYNLTEDKINLRTLMGQGQISVSTAGDQINIRGNSNNKTWQAVPDDNVSYSNTTLATFADGLLTGTPNELKVVEVAKSTGSGTTVNTFVDTDDVTLNVDTLTSTSVNLPTGSGIELSTEKYTPTAVSTEGPITQKANALVEGTDIDLDAVEVTSVEMLPPSGSSLELETYDYKPTSVSTEGPITKETGSLKEGSNIDLQAVKLQTQAITPPSGSSLDLETNQYATVDLGFKTTGIDSTVLKGGDNLTTTATELRSKSVPVQDTGVKEYTSKAFPPHTLTATAGTLKEEVGAGNDVTLSSVELSPTSLSGITLSRKTYTPTQVGTKTTTETSFYTGGNQLTTTPTPLSVTRSPVLEFDTKKYTSRQLEQLSLQKKTNILSKSASTAETTLEATALKTTSITPPSSTPLSLGTKTYTPRALSKQTLTKETTALKGGSELDTTVATLSTKKADIVSSTPNTYKARSLDKTTLSPQSKALHGGNPLTCHPTDLNTETLEAPELSVKTFTTTELGTASLSKQDMTTKAFSRVEETFNENLKQQLKALKGGTDYICTPTDMTTKAFSRVEESLDENLKQQSGALKGGTNYTCTPTAMTTRAFSPVEESLNEHLQQQSGTLKGGVDYTCNHTDFKVKTFSRVEESFNENLKQQSGALKGGADYTCTPTSMTTKSFTTQANALQGGSNLDLVYREVYLTDNQTPVWVLGPKNVPSNTSATVTAVVGVERYTGIKRSDGNTATNFHLYQSGTDPVTGNNKVLTTDSVSTDTVTLRKDIGTYVGVRNLSDASVYLYSTTGASDTRVYIKPPDSSPVENSHHLYYAASEVSDTKVLTTDSSDTTVTLKKDISDYVGVKNLSAPDVYFYSTTGATDTRVYLSPPDSNTTQNLYFAASPVTGNNKVLTVDSVDTDDVTLRQDIGTYTGVTNLSAASVYLYSTTGASDTRLYLSPPASETDSPYNLYFSTDAVTSSKVLTTTDSSTDDVTLRQDIDEYTGVTNLSATDVYLNTTTTPTDTRVYLSPPDSNTTQNLYFSADEVTSSKVLTTTDSSTDDVLFYTAESTGKRFLEADADDSNDDTTNVYCTNNATQSRNFLSNTTNSSKTTYHVYTNADSVSGQKFLKTDSDNTDEVLRTGMQEFIAIKGISSDVSLYQAPPPQANSSDTFLETASASAADTFLYSTSDDTPRRLLAKSGTDSDTTIQLYNAGTGDTVVETKVLELDSSATGDKKLTVGATSFDAVTGIPQTDDSVELYKAPVPSADSTDTFLETSESTDQHLYFSSGASTHSVITSSGTAINVVHTVDSSSGAAVTFSDTKFVKIKAGDDWAGDEKSFMHTIDDFDGVTATVGDGVNVYKAVDEDDNPSHRFLETNDSTGTESHIYATTLAATDTRFLTTGDSASDLFLYSTANNDNTTKFLTVPDSVQGQKILRSGMASSNAVTGIPNGTRLYFTDTDEPSDARFLKTTHTDNTDNTHILYVSDSTDARTFLTSSGSDIGILTSDSVSGVSAANYVKANNDSLSSGKVFKHTIGTYTGLSSNDNGNVIVYEAPDSTTRNFLQTGETAGNSHRVYSTDTSTTSTRFLSTSEDDSSLTSLNLYSTASPDTTTKFLKVSDSESGNKILKHGIDNFNAVTGIPNGTNLYHAGSASTHHFLKSPTALSDHHVYFSDTASDSSNKMPFVTSSGSSINIVKSSDDSNTGAFSLTRFLKTTGDNVAALDSVSKTFKHSFGTYTGINGDQLSNASNIYVYTTSAASSNSSEKFVKTTDTGDKHVFISANSTTRNFITSTGSAVNVLTAGSMSNTSTAKLVKTANTNVDALDSSKTFQHTFDTYTGMTGLSGTSDIRLYSTVGADTTKFVKTDANHNTTKFLYVSDANNPRTFITSTGSSNTNVLTSSSDVNVLTTNNVDPSSITLVKSVNTTPSTLQTVSDSVKVLKAP